MQTLEPHTMGFYFIVVERNYPRKQKWGMGYRQLDHTMQVVRKGSTTHTTHNSFRYMLPLCKKSIISSDLKNEP